MQLYNLKQLNLLTCPLPDAVPQPTIVFGATVTGKEAEVLMVLGVAVIMVIVDCATVLPLLLVEGSSLVVPVMVIVVLDITTTE